MSNPQYRKGANAERLLASFKRAQGWAVIRSAGSHSASDLWAARKGELEMYQLKAGKRKWPSRDERFALQVEAQRAGATPFIVFKEDRKPFEFVAESGWPKP